MGWRFRCVARYPRAPTLEQRCSLVTLAGMLDMEIVRDVVNTVGGQFATAVAVGVVLLLRSLVVTAGPVVAHFKSSY